MGSFERFSDFFKASNKRWGQISGFSSCSFDHKTTLPSAPIDLQRRLAAVSSQGSDKGTEENTVHFAGVQKQIWIQMALLRSHYVNSIGGFPCNLSEGNSLLKTYHMLGTDKCQAYEECTKWSSYHHVLTISTEQRTAVWYALPPSPDTLRSFEGSSLWLSPESWPWPSEATSLEYPSPGITRTDSLPLFHLPSQTRPRNISSLISFPYCFFPPPAFSKEHSHSIKYMY